MKASEIPFNHICYNAYLDRYGIVGNHYHDYAGKMVFWLHNFCITPADLCRDDYEDLGPAPQFKVTQEEVKKFVVKVEVIPPK